MRTRLNSLYESTKKKKEKRTYKIVYLDGGGAQLEVFTIAQSLTGGHHNGVTGVHSERIKILHVAHCRKQQQQQKRKEGKQ